MTIIELGIKTMKTNEQRRMVSIEEYHDYQITTILFVVFSSLVFGLVPILYGLSLTGTGNQQIVPQETSPWSVLGERS
jgi:hypothetical protein